MPDRFDSPPRVAVIGGGISGLAAALRVVESAPHWGVVLLEASPRLGGVIQSQRREGYLIERGPDMFTTAEPSAVDLCRRLGMEEELIGVNPDHRRAFVIRRGQLVPVPEGFTLMAPARVWPVISTPLLSPRGKLRLLQEYFIPPRLGDEDESLASFARRRLGREAYERLIQPLIGGIYTADPEKLSMAAALPQFVEMERRHGGIAKALRRRQTEHAERGVSGARYNRFVTPRGGMEDLIQRIAERLPAGSVRLGAMVEGLSRENGHWRLTIVQNGERSEEVFDSVVIAAPAFAAASLLRSLDGVLAEHLDGIPYASACVAVLAYRREQVSHPLDGFGCVAPAVENRNVLSISFSSVKFPGRAPEGRLLLRVFVGGALQPHLLDLPDDDLTKLVRKDLHELLGAQGEPEIYEIVRWRRAMPQYHVGHLDRVTAIEERVAQLPGLALAGNAYRGVGIPFCIRSGEAAAEQILAARLAAPGVS